MEWLRVAVVAQVVLLAYWFLVVLVPLGAWNDQPGRSGPTFDNLVLAFALAIPTIASILAFVAGLRWLMLAGIAFYTGWLWLQIQGWWVPYLFGASEKYLEMYQRVFGTTTKLLPSFEGHPAPDGMHLVLQLMLASVVAIGVFALVLGWSSTNPFPLAATTARQRS